MKPIELYIHIPFCARKCRYCDFLSFPMEESVKELYVHQLIEEIKVQSAYYQDSTVTSIYFGGGTPSILKSISIVNIMSVIYSCWRVEASAEVTIECNPGTLSAEKLMNYRNAGVSRISLGLQSTSQKDLELLGRIHTYEDFLKSYEQVRAAGFTNVNVDLMSALPGQSLEDWKRSLRDVAILKPEHISAYSLQIEPGTDFYEIYGSKEGQKLLPDEDLDREMYHATSQILAEYGYERYEISNYAKPGFACRHNVGYWTGVEYLGLGLGASSYCMGRRFHVERDLLNYIHMDLTHDITGLYQDVEELKLEDRISEFMFLGLRLTAGVSAAEYFDRFHRSMKDDFDYEISRNIHKGLLCYNPPMLRLTEKGLDVANMVMSDFIK